MNAKIGRPNTGRWPNFSVRINPAARQRARDAAIRQKKTLGKWLEEAILEKAERDEVPNRKGGK